jgi:thiol-disulfide isomerase/thioredoxin
MPARETKQGQGPHPAWVAVIAVVVLVGLALLQRSSTKSRLVGKAAPDFALDIVGERGSSGDRVHLGDLKGKTVLLDFWATWCEPCQVVAPILQRVSQKHGNDGLVVVGVNTSDRAGMAPLFAQKHGLSYPIVYDAGDAVAHLYGVGSLPTLVVINARGEIAATRTGAESESEIEALIREAD